MQKSAYTIHKQYLQDISFSNRSSAVSSRQLPNVEVSVSIEVRPLGQEIFESKLVVKFKASVPALAEEEGAGDTADQQEVKVLFLGYVGYAAVFKLHDAPASEDEEKNPDSTVNLISMVDVPALLFPFVREIVASVVSSAGFAPLLIEPIDFEHRYRESLKS